jgi:hypothetical protein
MTFYYLTVALIQLVFAVIAFRLVRSSKNWYALPVFIVICGIIYDNLIIGFGSFIGEGDLLKALNVPRFVIHAFFTPTLIIFGFGVLKRVGISWAQNKVLHSIVCLFVVGLIALGVYDEIIKLDLAPIAEDGTLRYKNASSAGPPIPAILTIIFVMIFGIITWWKTKSPWLFAGSFLFFCLAPFSSAFVWVGNLGEIFMSISTTSGERLAQEKAKLNLN